MSLHFQNVFNMPSTVDSSVRVDITRRLVIGEQVNTPSISEEISAIKYLSEVKSPKRMESWLKLSHRIANLLRAVLNKSWRQHPTRLQLYGHLPPITKTIQVRRTRHAGHCWRSKDELISDVLLWTPTYGCARVGRPARTYLQQLCEDTGCNPEDLPEAMNDREKWWERVRDIRAGGATWWWWLIWKKGWLPTISKNPASHTFSSTRKERVRVIIIKVFLFFNCWKHPPSYYYQPC